MKRLKVVLLDPETREPVDHWFSTPTPYILELMAEHGVDFNVPATIDVDGIASLTDKDLAALKPADRKVVGKLRDRVAAMSDEEIEAMRAERAQAKLRGLQLTNAMLASFLTMNEDEGSDGMPLKLWSRKQAADIIPWDSYQTVTDALNELVSDAMRGGDQGNAKEQAATK